MKEITFEVYHEYLEQRLKELHAIADQLKTRGDISLYLEIARYMDSIMERLSYLDSAEELEEEEEDC